jgi:tetratricopeptide (TPR) repeat protein
MYFGEVAVELGQINLLTVQTHAEHYGEEALASALNNLALLHTRQGRPQAAYPLYKQAHKIRETIFGADHPAVAESTNNLAALLYSQGAVDEALVYFEQSLAIREACLGASHLDVADSLNNLAVLLNRLGRWVRQQAYNCTNENSWLARCRS